MIKIEGSTLEYVEIIKRISQYAQFYFEYHEPDLLDFKILSDILVLTEKLVEEASKNVKEDGK